MKVTGYKGFNADLTGYNQFKYEIGKTYTMPADLIGVCKSGFHFCRYSADVFNFYKDSNCVYARITAQDRIIDDSDKSVTNHITIDEVISREQLRLEMPTFVDRISRTTEWYLDGKRHRLNGPAVEWDNGDKKWYQDGKLHRLDGPAIEKSNGHKEWYLNGQLHRLEGPAIEKPNGYRYWYQNGQLHRFDGPAIENSRGHKEWYLDGKLHRVDGPALEWANGDKEWYIDGQLHRFDGPAIEYANGDKEWYIDRKFQENKP